MIGKLWFRMPRVRARMRRAPRRLAARGAPARRSTRRARSSCSRGTTTATRRARGGADDPADAQARQAVRLRQSARDDHAIGPAPHRRRLAAVELGAAIDLVGEDPAAVPCGDRRNAIEIGGLEPRAGRVVRIADDDQLRARRDQTLERVDIDAPSAAAIVRPAASRGSSRRTRAPGPRSACSSAPSSRPRRPARRDSTS